MAPWTLAALLTACSPSPDPQAPEPRGAPSHPSLVLITLDTTRADFIGAYGREDARTETIDALAAAGRRYDRAYSPLPLTIPAHSTIFTGLEVYHHGVRNNGDAVLPQERETLAEILSDSGYDTAASIAAFVTQRRWGFAQGFDTYLDALPDVPRARANRWRLSRPADAVVDDALGWLSERDESAPFFLWVHLYDAHLPFEPPPAYSDIADPYAAELAFMDDQIRRLVDAVGTEEVLWVIAGDHGEGRGAHYEISHGLFIYDATQRVPLILSGAGLGPEVVSQPVGLVDLMPTVLHTLGLPVPAGLDGAVQPGAPHPIYLETYQLTDRFGYAPHRGLVDGDYKLVDTPRPELFRLDLDPEEREDRADAEPAVLARMRAQLEALAVPPPSRGAQSQDPEVLAQLAALGYLGGDAPPEGPLDDPKDHREVIGLQQRAMAEMMSGDSEQQIALLERALALEPTLREARVQLSRVYAKRGDAEAARRHVEASLVHTPESRPVLLNALTVLTGLGENERALEIARQGAVLYPDDEQLAQYLVDILGRLERLDEAQSAAEDFLERHTQAYTVAAAVGVHLATRGAWARAEDFLRLADEAEPPGMNVNYSLGLMAARAGKPEAAMRRYERELALYPQNAEARAAWAGTLGRAGRYAEQLAQIELLLRRYPDVEEFHRARALTLFNLGRIQEALDAAQGSLERFPESPGLHLVRANALGKLGRKPEAEVAFQRATSLRAAGASR